MFVCMSACLFFFLQPIRNVLLKINSFQGNLDVWFKVTF